MYRLLSRLIRRLSALSPAAAPLQGVAQQLMERAEAHAGRQPRQALELRRAAYAYLSVIR